MDQNLEYKRHTLAHLLAAAIMKRYPDAKRTIGPAIDNGFYFDFEFPTDKPSESDLQKIEKDMRKLLPSWKEFTKHELTADEAKKEYPENPYKHELIDEFTQEGKKVSFYKSGEYWDLCAGGHSDNPAKEIPTDSFKLDRIAGAYWRGDENNTMLTRIYGLAFDTKEKLDQYLETREKAKERDHRKIGKDLDLFTFSDIVGPGLPLYTPRGQEMIDNITNLLMEISKKYGYQKVGIPHLTKIDLYETSGHAAKFKDEFFYVKGAQSNDEFVLKPMNCPHHTQIYASKPRSYRDLPIRMSEITRMYRDEKPGQLLGLSRVRAIQVDDAHIFCREDQIKEEAINVVKIIEEFYTAFGLWNKGETFWVSLSVRDPKTPDNYLGDPKGWDRAETYLQEVSDDLGLDAKRMEGEAAFYGPKLDFMFTDALGRERQLGTVQIDFVMPERFELEYTDSDGKKTRPVMVHRAIAGSLERFLVIIIEHFNGKFPLWLSPTQVKVLPVSEKHAEYAEGVVQKLKEADIRVELDASNESLGKRIRNAKHEKVPYFFVVGDKEVESDSVTVENREESEGSHKVEDVIERLKEEITNRSS